MVGASRRRPRSLSRLRTCPGFHQVPPTKPSAIPHLRGLPQIQLATVSLHSFQSLRSSGRFQHEPKVRPGPGGIIS